MHLYFLLALTLTPSLVAAAEPGGTVHMSPPQQRIAAAQRRVAAEPKSTQSYNDLAFALCRWARDTGELSLYDQAQKALDHSFQLSKEDYDAEKLQVTVLLGKLEFAEALKRATAVNQKAPDDIAGWGLLVDANVALGNYAAAERAAQWILDLRSGSSLGFLKAAVLREVFGDLTGAAEYFDETIRRTSQSDADEQAWLLTQNAHVQLLAGSPQRAEELLNQALQLFPDSRIALANLARVRMAQENFTDAATLLERRYRAAPSAANLYEWAEALERSGRKEEALASFRDFEVRARAEMTKPHSSNRELIFLYTDHKSNHAEALELAMQAGKVRQDVATLDAYSWALYRNGEYGEARNQIDRVLAIGVREPVYFCHAARIAMKANDRVAAARFEKELAGFGVNVCPVDPATQPDREVAR